MLLNRGVGEDSWVSLGQQGDQTSQSYRKLNLNIHWKDWCRSSNTWPSDVKGRLIGKDPDAGKDWRQGEKGTTEDEMAGWHHRLDGHEFEQTLGRSGGQRSLVCYSLWGHRESDMTATEQLVPEIIMSEIVHFWWYISFCFLTHIWLIDSDMKLRL